MLDIIQLPVLNDNYIYLIHEPSAHKTAVIDPAISQPVLDCLNQKGWGLDYIWNTHHHSDHTGANFALKAQTNCTIIGFAGDRHRIEGIDKTVKHGDKVTLGHQFATVIETPGHTSGHIVYHFLNADALFCGDTLFSMGCGRLFEGSAEQMWQSLQLIKKIPKQTRIFCAHEYTQANGQFALTLEPSNPNLLIRIQQVNQLRAANKPTIPSTLKQELDTNPFLREHSLEIQKSMGLEGESAVDIFAGIRLLKDNV